MTVNLYHQKWMGNFQKLVEYNIHYKSTQVPRNYMEDPQFGTWVSTQRWFYNKNVLNPNRLALLNSIGFKWVADNNGAINNAAKKRKQQKAETERRIAEKEKIQDDKRAKKAEVVADRKEEKRKRAEENEQKVSQCNTNYCSECLCIICIIL